MKRNNTLFVVFIFLFISSMLFSQVKIQQQPTNVGDLLRKALYNAHASSSLLGINPDKLKMNHSYSLGFSSFGGNSLTQGMYLNTISYQFDIPLSVKFQWGFMHQPFATGGLNTTLTNQFFLSGAELNYRPLENLTMRLQFYQRPAGLFYPSNYYRSDYPYRSSFDRWWDEE
jgi:hypothetical protein